MSEGKRSVKIENRGSEGGEKKLKEVKAMVEMKMINGVQYQVEEGIYNPIVKESSFERMGGTYRMEGGEYLVPNLELKQERVALGKYGRMRENFLKEHKKTYYTSLKIQGQLMNHLQGVEKEAQRILEIEIPRYQKKRGGA